MAAGFRLDQPLATTAGPLHPERGHGRPGPDSGSCASTIRANRLGPPSLPV